MGNIIKKNKKRNKDKEENPNEIELIKKPYYQPIKSKSFNEFDRRNAILLETKSILNIKILGPSGVGKTALINRFVMNQFINQYNSTLNTTSTRVINLQGDNE